MNDTLLFILACILAYLFGSIPVGTLAARTRGINIKQVGSGNTGATNVTRALGWGWGSVVGVLDFGKSFLPALIAQRLYAGDCQTYLLALLPVIGHIFPVWLHFRGGKGVATIFGILGAFFGLPIFLAFLLIWVLVVRLVKLMSLVNLGVALLIPLAFWLKFHTLATTIFGLVLGGIIWWTHRANIRRLAAGRENKIGS